jgi:hypothetical protein
MVVDSISSESIILISKFLLVLGLKEELLLLLLMIVPVEIGNHEDRWAFIGLFYNFGEASLSNTQNEKRPTESQEYYESNLYECFVKRIAGILTLAKS